MSLGDLFAAADKVGNKYQAPEEIAAHQQELYEINQEIKGEIKPSRHRATIQSAIAAYGAPEALSIGDQAEIDLMAHNMPIPDAGRGRFGNLLAFMED